jgi:Lamin Tail Domain
MRQRAILVVATAALGIAAAAVVTPAFAATAPTISAPSSATGYSEITISGKAGAGSTVTLYETAYIWDDLQPATNWDTGDTVTATAGSTGAYSIKRYVDSGFKFQVEAGGARSATVTVAMKVLPYLTAASTTSGTVAVHVAPSPNQPWLPVEIQRQSGSSWTKVSGGYTDDTGSYDATIAGQGPGTSQTYRAYVGADPANDITPNYSATRTLTIHGTGTTAPTSPAAGSVQFTKIQYHGASGLNNEWTRLTNKTSKSISLTGWTVKDAAGNTYTFGSYSLSAGKNVYVHTGAGTNGKPDLQHRYWGRTGYIWNNGGDTATLRAGSKTIDSCKWTSDKGVTYC